MQNLSAGEFCYVGYPPNNMESTCMILVVRASLSPKQAEMSPKGVGRAPNALQWLLLLGQFYRSHLVLLKVS